MATIRGVKLHTLLCDVLVNLVLAFNLPAIKLLTNADLKKQITVSI